MLRKTRGRLELIDPVSYDEPQDAVEDIYNPEVDAKNMLIEISNQAIDQNFLERENYADIKVKKPKELFRVKETKVVPAKDDAIRLSVADHFTQSHRIRKKKSVRLLDEQAGCEAKPDYSKNQSSFIIFQNGYLNNYTPNEYSQLAFGEAFPRTQKIKPPRNIMSLIKRKNINIKQQSKLHRQQNQSSIVQVKPHYSRNLSPTQRISKSCELQKMFESISPIKISTNDRAQEGLLELRCTNPNFRNKVSNYIKMRAVANREARAKAY